ncbi:hypothetical protein VTI28DRAFT_9696 [Corynascus sepedonium]
MQLTVLRHRVAFPGSGKIRRRRDLQLLRLTRLTVVGSKIGSLELDICPTMQPVLGGGVRHRTPMTAA